MQALLFNIKSTDGDIKARIERTAYPAVGDSFLVLDYPYVVRYVVDHFESRNDVLPIDFLEPVTIVLRRDRVLEKAAAAPAGPHVDLSKNFIARLERMGELARTYITEKLVLEISHAEFLDLCQEGGVRCEPLAFDLCLFRGIPMTIGEEGHEWNASTAFTGFNDDMSVLYVTFPGGDPMVMDPTLLNLTRRVASGEMPGDEALAEVCLQVGLRAPVDPVLLRSIENAIALAADGIMPPYEAAQDVIRITGAARRQSADCVLSVEAGPDARGSGKSPFSL